MVPVLYIILPGLVVMATVLFLLPLRFNLTYHRLNEDDEIAIRLGFAYGFGQLKIEVSLLNWRLQKFWPALEMFSQVVGDESPPEKEVVKNIVPGWDQLYRAYRLMTFFGLSVQDYFQLSGWFLRRIKCRALKWRTVIGLENPAATGIAVGMIWGLKSTLYAKLQRQVQLEPVQSLDIKVFPDFQHQRLQLDFNCIFDFRLGHIIIAGIRAITYAKVMARG